MRPEFAALELRDLAVRFITQRGTVTEEEVLEHVYGGVAPAALRARLAAPLLADPRLERLPDGSWTLRGRRASVPSRMFVALALAATGPTPARAALVRVCALRVREGEIGGRFDAMLKPGRRVPRYVAERAGVDSDVLDEQPAFADVLDEFIRFLGDGPVLSQDAQLTWAFVESEARRLERVIVRAPLVDVNDLASRLLTLKGKPSLALVAAALGIASGRMARVDEEARVLALVGARLLSMAGEAVPAEAAIASAALRRGATARSLPDQPGVYVLLDNQQTPLYVGKARRLSSRLAAYVHRPLGPTRHLEGLTGAVDSVDSTQCATDLEALILEDREIRRLQPRFNTVRQLRAPRFWIRLPPTRSGKRAYAPPRLELSDRPADADGQFVGPFRNEMLAEQARRLAREVFELDELRHGDRGVYLERLRLAWAFLQLQLQLQLGGGGGLGLGGESEVAEALARRRSVGLLRQVLAFRSSQMLLPADPRHARYAVVRPGERCIEGFLIDRAILRNWMTFTQDDASAFARRLLAPVEARTTPDDVAVVLRWFGAQRPPARLAWLPEDDDVRAADAIEDAVYALASAEA